MCCGSSVLQCVAVCCLGQGAAVYVTVYRVCVALGVLHCAVVAVCCSVLQSVAVCCLWQVSAVYVTVYRVCVAVGALQCAVVVVCCSVLQCVASDRVLQSMSRSKEFALQLVRCSVLW